ncbi:hypothetical protein GF373_13845 [bacterium]|nr:hypothetical protein [bacterium]
MNEINLAMIGAGFIADYHAKALQNLAGVKIRVVCALDQAEAENFAARYGIPEAVSHAESLFQEEGIDAALLCTPNKFHAPFAIGFLNHGKDVFIEKPMAINADEGEQIAQAARANNRLVMVGHMWRFDEEVHYIKHGVESGQIGRIIKTKGYGIHENWGPDGWFTQKELAGGGALADMGVHAIDTVRYLLGDPQPVQVFAKIGTYYGDFDVDDTGILLITWDNNTHSIIESGWWHPHMDGPEAGTRLFGTKGYASLFPTKLRFKVGEIPGDFIAPMPDKEDHCSQAMYNKQMEHFIDCIRTRETPSPGMEEGLAILKIVDAAYNSAKLNKEMNL